MNEKWSVIIRALEDSGLTQKQIGAKVGLSISAISDIKTGRSNGPRGWCAVRLHNLYRQLPRRAA